MQKKLYDNIPLNKLLVVNKPLFRSSNSYLNEIKREYRNKKAGFSGTLDPFACGNLIVAFGQYTKLFKYLKKTPKKYQAVIWLGVTSISLDIENIESIEFEKRLNKEKIEKVIKSCVGDIDYYPPKFSAKKIDGKRAYELARLGVDVKMKKSTMSIKEATFLSYNHPFITFEVSVSEGSYIRSLAQIILEKLEVKGTLSYLNRVSEGEFVFENQKDLNPLDYLDLKRNIFLGDQRYLEDGKKLSLDSLKYKDDGKYMIVFDEFFTIIEVQNQEVSYLLNKVRLN